MAQVGQDRRVKVSSSQFHHEAEGLALVRKIMTDETPFRTWSNFEFRDSDGRWHKVHLLPGRDRLHLIGLKYNSGTPDGDDQRWARDGRHPEDSSLKLARRKARYLPSKLRDELQIWAREQRVRIFDERDVVPFLGQGSMAVGLLVHDQLVDGADAECVQKIAFDTDAAGRLDDEVEMLRRLDSRGWSSRWRTARQSSADGGRSCGKAPGRRRSPT